MTTKKILIDGVFRKEIRTALINGENHYIDEIEYQTSNKHQIKSNIYLAKIIRIEPSLQAAFVDYGSSKNGFLPFNEIHPAYYNIQDKFKDKSQYLDLKSITPLEIHNLEQDSETEQLSHNNNIDISINDAHSDITIEIDENELDKLETNTEEKKQDKLFKIEDVLKRGQIILIQAQKEERGNKGASFTSYISLAGKYCVLTPNKQGQNGISRRISNLDERRRLKNLVAQFTANHKNSSSIIVRTAGVGKTSYEIKRDYDYLVRLWNKIREVTVNSVAPTFIHREEDIIQKTIRDLFDQNISEILVEGQEAYNAAADFMQNILPHDVNRLKQYTESTPIFTKFNIEEQLSNLYQPIINLPSGGYIVINPTEALIAIDVNSGRSISEKNIEETALKTNLEACKEITRQAKLRDLSGLIVIDFIDMADIKHRRLIERTFKDSFSRDKARIQIGTISSFGLLEMSRQRLRPSFTEANSIICLHCNGKGIVRADESNSMLILRTIENEIFKGIYDKINIYTTLPSVMYILNNKREQIGQIEQKYNVTLNFFEDSKATAESFSIEKIKFNAQYSDNLDDFERNTNKAALVSKTDLYNKLENLESVPSTDTEVKQKTNINSKKTKWKNNQADRRKNMSNNKVAANPTEVATIIDIDSAAKIDTTTAKIPSKIPIVTSIENDKTSKSLDSITITQTVHEQTQNIESNEVAQNSTPKKPTRRRSQRFNKSKKSNNISNGEEQSKNLTEKNSSEDK